MVKFHGCAYGFTDDEGVPIQKAWTVATNDEFLYNELAAHQCPGCVRHRWCEGKFSKRSEDYTDLMAYGIHEAWRKSVRHDLAQQMKVVPCAVAATKSQRRKERAFRGEADTLPEALENNLSQAPNVPTQNKPYPIVRGMNLGGFRLL